MVQKIASAARSDRMLHEDIEILSNIGSCGVHQPNCRRDLLRHCAPCWLVEATTTFNVSFKHEQVGIVPSKQECVLPHTLFAFLYHRYRDTWLELVMGGHAKLNRFWSDMATGEQFRDHPVRERADHRERCVPLGMHGDGVACLGVGQKWQKTWEAYSWQGLTGVGGMANNYRLH